MMLVALPFFLFFWVMHTIATVGVQRKALGLIEKPVFVYFTLDGAVWRLIGAMFVATVLVYLALTVLALGVVAIFAAGKIYKLPAIYGLVEALAVIAIICAYFYIFVRLTFFLPAVVVAEGGFGLARSWELGGGNFWRVVALIIVCVFAPMMALSMISSVVTTPLMMSAMWPLQHSVEQHQILTPAQTWAMMMPMFKILIPFTIAYQAITWPILLGLTNGVSATAYRNVTGQDPLSVL
jgi:hypothetical protein